MDSKKGETGRVVFEVVVRYRPADDPKAEPRTLTLRHKGDGAEVDSLSWSSTLMSKLAYLEGEECRKPTIRTASEWELVWDKAEERPDCVWLHELGCEWVMHCQDGAV